MLKHKLLGEEIEIRLNNLVESGKGTEDDRNSIGNGNDSSGKKEKENEDENIFMSNKYLALYSNLKALCNKQRMIETYNFVKIKVYITNTTISNSKTSSNSPAGKSSFINFGSSFIQSKTNAIANFNSV